MSALDITDEYIYVGTWKGHIYSAPYDRDQIGNASYPQLTYSVPYNDFTSTGHNRRINDISHTETDIVAVADSNLIVTGGIGGLMSDPGLDESIGDHLAVTYVQDETFIVAGSGLFRYTTNGGVSYDDITVIDTNGDTIPIPDNLIDVETNYYGFEGGNEIYYPPLGDDRMTVTAVCGNDNILQTIDGNFGVFYENDITGMYLTKIAHTENNLCLMSGNGGVFAMKEEIDIFDLATGKNKRCTWVKSNMNWQDLLTFNSMVQGVDYNSIEQWNGTNFVAINLAGNFTPGKAYQFDMINPKLFIIKGRPIEPTNYGPITLTYPEDYFVYPRQVKTEIASYLQIVSNPDIAGLKYEENGVTYQFNWPPGTSIMYFEPNRVYKVKFPGTGPITVQRHRGNDEIFYSYFNSIVNLSNKSTEMVKSQHFTVVNPGDMFTYANNLMNFTYSFDPEWVWDIFACREIEIGDEIAIFEADTCRHVYIFNNIALGDYINFSQPMILPDSTVSEDFNIRVFLNSTEKEYKAKVERKMDGYTFDYIQVYYTGIDSVTYEIETEEDSLVLYQSYCDFFANWWEDSVTIYNDTFMVKNTYDMFGQVTQQDRFTQSFYNVHFIPDTSGSNLVKALEPEINIFPNPSTGIVSVELNQSFENVQVYNAVGQQIYYHQLSAAEKQFEIDLSAFQAGVYFVKLENDTEKISKKIFLSEE